MGIVKNIILGVSIAIIFAFFIGFGIQTFYPSPEWEDFCGERKPMMIDSQKTCEDQGGRWNPHEGKPVAHLRADQLLCTRTAQEDDILTLSCTSQETQRAQGYCDVNYYCEKEHDTADEIYTKNLFIITAIIGLITMIIGGFVLKHESVSPGLMGGGFITILYGVVRYWRYAGDWLRFIILGIVLAILIYLGYKKLPFKKS